jgi:hypothetical protein
MRYIKGYSKFINESKREIEKNALIVEKQVLNEFSSDFWSLCLRSKIFTNEEKSYIENNLIGQNVSLVTEEWEWLDKAVDWAKDKGEKMLNFVGDKIKAVKNGLKEFVSSMVTYAKNMFMSMIKGALNQAAKFKEKVTGDGKIKKQIDELNPEKSKNEIADLKKTFQFWAPGKTVAEAAAELITNNTSFDKIGGQIEAKLKTAEAEAVSSTEKNLSEAEADAKNESVSSIIHSTNDDILESFYNLSLIKEAEESPEGGEEKKTTGQKCIDWILSFLGQEKLDPEAKKGTKIFWWGKLFLKILATCLSPILKVVEALVKTGANYALQGVSMITGVLGGPGAFKFALIGGLCGGIVGIIYDSIMLFGGSAGGADTMAAVKAWLSHAINEALELFPSYKTLKYILAGFCAGMTLWHVVEEIKHLMHAGHGEHEEGEAKEGEAVKPGEKPVATKPGEKPEPVKPGEKPATGGAPAPATA